MIIIPANCQLNISDGSDEINCVRECCSYVAFGDVNNEDVFEIIGTRNNKDVYYSTGIYWILFRV